MFRLIAAIGPDKGRIFNLTSGAPLVMGRRNANILLSDHNVSRQQAQLLVRDHHWWIIDLRSTNGTFVNGSRIAQAHILKHGDQIRVGRSVLVFQSIAILKRAAQRPQQPPQSRPAIDPRAIDELERHITTRIQRDGEQLAEPAGPKPRPAAPVAEPRGPAQRTPANPAMPSPKPVPHPQQTKPPQPELVTPASAPPAPTHAAQPVSHNPQQIPLKPAQPNPVPVAPPEVSSAAPPVHPPKAPPEVTQQAPPAAPPEVTPQAPPATPPAAPPEVTPQTPPATPPAAPPEVTQQAPPATPPAAAPEVTPQASSDVSVKPVAPSPVPDAAIEAISDGIPSPAEPSAADAAAPIQADEIVAVDQAADDDGVPSPAQPAAPETPDTPAPLHTDDAFAAAQTIDPGESEADTAAQAALPMFGVADEAQPITATPSVDFEPAARADDAVAEVPRPDGDVASAETDDAQHTPHALEHDAESAEASAKTDGDAQQDVELHVPQAVSDVDDDQSHAGADNALRGEALPAVDDHDIDEHPPPTGMYAPADDAPYVAYAEDDRHTAPTENGHGRYDIPADSEPSFASDDRFQHVQTHADAMLADAIDGATATAAASVGEDGDGDAMFETVTVAVAVIDDQPEALEADRFGLAAFGDDMTLLGMDSDDASDEREYCTDRFLAGAADPGAGAIGTDATDAAQAVRADGGDEASVDAFSTTFHNTERTTFPSRQPMEIVELFEAAALTGDHAIVDDMLDATDIALASPPGDTEAVTHESTLDAVGPEVDDEIEDELTKPPPKAVDFERLRRPVHDDDHDAGSTSLLYATEQAVEEVDPDVKAKPAPVSRVDETGRPETPHVAAPVAEEPSVDYYAWEERQRNITRTKWLVGVGLTTIIVSILVNVLAVTQMATKKEGDTKTIIPVAPQPTPVAVDPLGADLPETSEDRMDSVRSSIRDMVKDLPEQDPPNE